MRDTFFLPAALVQSVIDDPENRRGTAALIASYLRFARRRWRGGPARAAERRPPGGAKVLALRRRAG